jgi:hypothetical protein
LGWWSNVWGAQLMTDAMDTALHDDDLLAEIELTSELIILATESTGPVSQRSIDAVLRIDPNEQS